MLMGLFSSAVNCESVYFHADITSLESKLHWCDCWVVDLAQSWPGSGRNFLGYGLVRHILSRVVHLRDK